MDHPRSNNASDMEMFGDVFCVYIFIIYTDYQDCCRYCRGPEQQGDNIPQSFSLLWFSPGFVDGMMEGVGNDDKSWS